MDAVDHECCGMAAFIVHTQQTLFHFHGEKSVLIRDRHNFEFTIYFNVCQPQMFNLRVLRVDYIL